MFDPHKTPSFFLPPSPNERKWRRSERSIRNSVSSSEVKVEAGERPVTVIPSPPSSPSFLFRNAVLLHVNPDSVAENAGLYDDDDDDGDNSGRGDRDGRFPWPGSRVQ